MAVNLNKLQRKAEQQQQRQEGGAVLSDERPFVVHSRTKITLSPLAKEWAEYHGMSLAEMGRYLIDRHYAEDDGQLGETFPGFEPSEEPAGPEVSYPDLLDPSSPEGGITFPGFE